jgi:hyaluronate lyase
MVYGSLGTANIRDTKWHHVAVTFDRQTYMTGYVDGIVQSTPKSISARTGSIANANNLFIGVYGDGVINYFNGTIDEVRIFDRALSPEEVATLGTNQVNIMPDGIATFMHTCLQPVCQYSIVTGGYVKPAYVSC